MIRGMSVELKLPADHSVSIKLLANLPVPAVTRKCRLIVPGKLKVHLSLISQVATNNTSGLHPSALIASMSWTGQYLTKLC